MTIVDSRDLPDDHLIHADICIVGSGPVGCAVAQDLLGAGLRICVLEAGALAYDTRAQSAFWSEEARNPERHQPLHLWRRRMLGGASTVWGGRCLPLTPGDFDSWAPAWPIAYDEIDRYLPRAASFLELGSSDFSASTALAPDDQPFLGGYQNADLATEMVERYSPPTNVATRYWSEMASAPNLTVLFNAPCVEIRLDESGMRVDRAVFAPTLEKRCSIRASTIVLAGGGLETARLLLASNKDRGRGLGNENDLVGRHYMTHIVGNLGLLSTDACVSHRELSFVRTTDGVYSRRNFQLSDSARRTNGLGGFVLRPSIGRIGDHKHGSGVLSALFLARSFLKNELYSNMGRRSTDEYNQSGLALYFHHFANITVDAPSILSFSKKWLLDRPKQYRKLPGYDFRRKDNTYPLEFNSEQFPNPASRVYLGQALDPLGVPLLSVDWRTCDEDLRTIRRGFEIVQAAVSGSTVAKILCTQEEIEAAVQSVWPAGGHHIGTARLSSSPSEGVVGPDMQVWSVSGLYVVGSAVFPRSGCANPTLSATALALRLAEQLVANHQTDKSPCVH